MGLLRLERASAVRRRRQILGRVGLCVLALATACATAACIFDQGDYKGGGRLPYVPLPEEEEEDLNLPLPTGTAPPPDSGSP